VSEPQKSKGLRPELRILVASLLSMVVIIAWAKFFAPKAPPPSSQTNKPAATSPTNPGQGAGQAPTVMSPGGASTANPPAASMTAAPSAPAAAKSDKQERTIVIENSLYRVEFSNRGGVVKSWQLKKYKDDAKPQRTLDLVHPDASQELNAWPLSVSLSDANLDQTANAGLYQESTTGSETSAQLTAPAELNFSWSDGRLEVTKRFKFDDSYVVHAEVSAKLDGKPIIAGLAWLGGFGDTTVSNPIPVETVNTVYSQGGKLEALPHKKLDDAGKWGPAVWAGGKDWAGVEDRYFVAIFLAPLGAPAGGVETRYWKTWHTIKVTDNQGKVEDKAEPVPQVAVATSAQPAAMRIFVGPKDYDDLKKMNPPLQSLVNFGWMEIIADPLFHALKWLHKYIPNWGWAIVVLTLIANMLLFPLRISSYKTTMKMQRVGPEIKSIQEKYKKYKMNDPRKAEMNKEVMAVYQREGINPVGGCFQMLVQMPIWFGLNRALSSAIEMRHAPWFGWITDLSAKDPYYILPVVMAGSMYLVSKMTPMTSTDPQQQMMMKFMPISFAGMFIIFPISSGLAVYILTSSLVGIGQQWYLNRTHPVTVPVKANRGKKS
jgi:YidC/Oxa1 family membrane protein insertase